MRLVKTLDRYRRVTAVPSQKPGVCASAGLTAQECQASVWAVAPDGTGQHKLTWGAYDDREPAWSHDGTRIAFSSDRGNPLGSDYNIWVLDVASGSGLPAHEGDATRP